MNNISRGWRRKISSSRSASSEIEQEAVVITVT